MQSLINLKDINNKLSKLISISKITNQIEQVYYNIW